jgi:Na+/melibiose symporter-like transporter
MKSRILPILVSIIILILSSVPLYFLHKDNRSWVYPLSAMQGIGIAIMLNTSTSLISDVIGTESESSAFVYGVYSLMDKFANGFLLYWIVAEYSDNEEALRIIMSSVGPVCSIFAFILSLIG